MQIAQRTEIGGVRVPRISVGIAIGDRRPVHLHEPGARFDQTSSEQAALAEGVAAVAVADFFIFLRKVERFAGAAGKEVKESA